MELIIKEDPYLIATVDDLVNVGRNLEAVKYFKLIADIDLAGVDWTPIGYAVDMSEKYLFQRHFDGKIGAIHPEG